MNKWLLRWARKLALSFFYEQLHNHNNKNKHKHKKKNKDCKMSTDTTTTPATSPETFPDKKPSSINKIEAETNQVKQELSLPALFDSYTYTYKNGVVTTLGGIAELDQQKLVALGWTKLTDQQFSYSG